MVAKLPYGYELILDLKSCDTSKFNRKAIDLYFKKLCNLIEMEPAERYWWDYENYPEEYAQAPPHLKGVSAVQFIMTSTITIHTLETLKEAYINIFSCKTFDPDKALKFTIEYFKAQDNDSHFIERGKKH